MAIKTSTQGDLPAVNLDHMQFSEFHMTIGEHPPYTKSVSAKIRAYGLVSGVKYYSKDYMPPLSIANLDTYITVRVPAARKAEAALAMQKVQEGLGVLASIYHNIDFIGVE